MKPTRSLISSLILVFVSGLFACETAPAKPPFLGVFSNKASRFDIKTIMLMDDGKGMVCGGGGCGPIVWKLGATNGDIILTGPTADFKNIIVHYDSNKKTITMLDKRYAEGSGPLLFITNEVPNAKELQKKLRYFDGSQESLEPKGAVFAFGVTNRPDDLAKLQKAIGDQDLPCQISTLPLELTGSPKYLLVYLRDFDQVRKIATKVIARDKLSVRIRNDKDTKDYEVWENGKKVRIEPYAGKGPINTVVPVQLE
jgi:hypothetical protein